MMSPAPHGNEENDKGPVSDREDEDVDNFHTPQFVIDADSSDGDEEDDDNEEDDFHGYQMLPQDPGENVDMSDSEEETEDAPAGDSGHHVELNHPNLHQVEGAQLPSYMQVPDVPKPDSKEMLWNKQRPQAKSLSLEKEHVDKIKEAMSGISLPSINIPEWAKNISEQEWRDKLSTLQQDKSS